MKLFGVTTSSESQDPPRKPFSEKPLPHVREKEHEEQTSRDFHTIDVHVDDARIREDDIGQIALDIFETNTDIVIMAPVAGVDPDEVDISVARNILTLSGNRVHPPIYLDAKKTLVDECFYGTFSRSIILPENLAFNKIHATVEFNLIQIFVPKLKFSSHTVKIART